MRTNFRFSGSLAVAALLLLPLRSLGAEPTNPGREAYLRYCGACHGESGKGDGAVSQLMRPKPINLTTLAKDNNGEFPTTRVINAIDGRETVRAHGDSDMPVWGDIFKMESGKVPGQEYDVRSKVILITDYLRSIQQK